MNVLDLTQQLDHVWAIFTLCGGDNIKVIDCKSEFEKNFKQGVALSAVSCEVSAWAALNTDKEGKFHPLNEKEGLIRSFDRIGSLWYEDLIQSQLDGEEFDDCVNDYCDLCERIATALDVDTDDRIVNPDYFSTAQRDNLTPYQAVMDLKSE